MRELKEERVCNSKQFKINKQENKENKQMKKPETKLTQEKVIKKTQSNKMTPDVAIVTKR